MDLVCCKRFACVASQITTHATGMEQRETTKKEKERQSEGVLD